MKKDKLLPREKNIQISTEEEDKKDRKKKKEKKGKITYVVMRSRTSPYHQGIRWNVWDLSDSRFELW